MFREKYNAGKKLREKAPRHVHAKWKVPAHRPSVVSMINVSNDDRLQNLIPIRHSRMTTSPFVFYRATASLMAYDLSFTQSSGITVQACGDCHLMNFGIFATPERTMVADINDFDETNPGPWEWDLKRLATSFMLACREKNFSDKAGFDVTMELVSSYQNKMKEYAAMNFLELWYTKFTVEDIRKLSSSKKVHQRISATLKKANTLSHEKVFHKITQSSISSPKITDQPPLVYHSAYVEEHVTAVNQFIEKYKNTLQPDRRLLLDQYKVVDVALKVVGVGSVGTRCFVVLMMNNNDEPVFVQIKEARESVLEQYTQKSLYENRGERVVQGQRILQAASDIFLGWSVGPEGRHFYLRQLRDKKMSFNIDAYEKFGLIVYARLCGDILARAHCKSAQGPLICGYIGKGEVFANAICKFANAYADQTEKDYDAFMKAVKSGKLPVQEEGL